jgi:polyadenylate binding protein
MWSQRDPALRKTGAGNIFIKNLDENIDNKALHDTFAAFGNILSCKVAVGSQGESLGYGFVHYDAGEAAQAAIEGVNGMLLNDKVVFVGIHIPRRERQAKIDEVRAHYTNLYVKNVALDVTTEEFKALFDKYGSVTSAVITFDEENKSKGFGFVNYADHEDARKALEDLHEKDFRGQQLFVTRAQRKGEREEELKKSHEQKKYEETLKYQGVNLYVKNLDDDITEEKLQLEFEPFGQITSCKIMMDDKLVSKGFGFVCFSAPDEATKAVTELNGKMIGSKPLYVSLAQRKETRKSQLEAQVAQRNQIRTQQIVRPLPSFAVLIATNFQPSSSIFLASCWYPSLHARRSSHVLQWTYWLPSTWRTRRTHGLRSRRCWNASTSILRSSRTNARYASHGSLRTTTSTTAAIQPIRSSPSWTSRSCTSIKLTSTTPCWRTTSWTQQWSSFTS